MNNWEIVRNLTPEQRKVIDRLTEEGWEFHDGSWNDHHNGNEYNDVDFQSPNMREKASIDSRAWGEVTEKYLREREAYHAANDWAKDVFHYTSVITNPLAEGLKKHFLKKKSTKFARLFSTSAKFDVKVSPKVKDKPKKIKVLITIE
jgi:hypothetical protein